MKVSFEDGKATWEMSTTECAAAVVAINHALRELWGERPANIEAVRVLKGMSVDFDRAIEEAKNRANHIKSGS